MTRRAAFRQCDVVRAIKAAKAAGAARVIVRRDGALEIEIEPRMGDRQQSRERDEPRDEERLIVL